MSLHIFSLLLCTPMLGTCGKNITWGMQYELKNERKCVLPIMFPDTTLQSLEYLSLIIPTLLLPFLIYENTFDPPPPLQKVGNVPPNKLHIVCGMYIL